MITDSGLGLFSRPAAGFNLPRRTLSHFFGAALLIRILEGTGQAGRAGRTLSESLASGRAHDLSQGLAQLNPTDRETLQNSWGRSLAEIESLSHERDPQIFYAGLLQIGQRLEDNDQLEQAGLVYSALVAVGPHPYPSPPRGEGHAISSTSLPSTEGSANGMVSPSPLGGEGGRLRRTGEGLVPASIRDRAQVRLNAMTGVGSSGERIAFLARRISTEATRPDMLLAMGAAGAAFRLTRLATSARLAGTLESAWGLRAAAYGSGFLAETVAFTGVGKVAGQALGYQQDWNPEAVFHEWAGGATMFLGLKVTGALAGAAAQRYARGTGALERFTQVALPQVGMFGGIMLGHRLAEAGGFHPHREGDTWLVDGLSTLLQFNVAGRLQHMALGEGFSRFERRVDAHTERLTRSVGAGLVSAPVHGDWSLQNGRTQGPPLQGILDWVTDSLGPEFVTPEGMGIPQFSVEGGPAENPLTQTSVFSVRQESAEPGAAAPRLSPEMIAGRLEQMARPVFKGLQEGVQDLPAPDLKAAVRSIGILTSGGDGPAENAAIQALVFGAEDIYKWKTVGVLDGFLGLVDPQGGGASGRILEISSGDFAGAQAVRRAHQRIFGVDYVPRHYRLKRVGEMRGNILRSSRTDPLEGDPKASRVRETMARYGIDALVVMGGNGSQRAARDLAAQGIPLVFIPQSIDGDVPGSVTSLGFPSAVNKGAQEMAGFLATAHSCGRWFLVEVMGQRYGLLAASIGLSARQGSYFAENWKPGPPLRVDSVFSEIPRPFGEISELMQRRREAGQSHGVILISEGALFKGETGGIIRPPLASDAHGRLIVETGDLARWVRHQLLERGVSNTRPENLGYMLRGAEPSVQDRTLANVLTRGALELIGGGHFGRMVGLDFSPGTASLRMVYPELSEAVAQVKSLDPEQFEWVRSNLEDKAP